MTPYEMEQQLNNLNVRTKAIEQILPTLATKADLLVMKEELKTELKIGLEDARRYALMLNETTRDDLRLLAENILGMQAQLVEMNSRFLDRFDRIERRLG